MKVVTWINSLENMALFRCEVCGKEFKTTGRYDVNYYKWIRPNSFCPECGLNVNGKMDPEKLGQMTLF